MKYIFWTGFLISLFVLDIGSLATGELSPGFSKAGALFLAAAELGAAAMTALLAIRAMIFEQKKAVELRFFFS